MNRVMLSLAVLLITTCQTLAGNEGRPNIVWISCEDISTHLGSYGDRNATTPNLDRFATEAIRYTQAFTCHGVCAPSRTGIITGMDPVSLGANHMRSKARLPAHIKLFPTYLRNAGYYCTNNSKTDYNLEWDEKTVWDESSAKAHWKNRLRPDQPFFAVFNLTMTHESKLWPEGWKDVIKGQPVSKLHRPENMVIPPIYPDTPEVRAAFARLLDVIMVMDQEAGRLLRELDDAGLSDNTVVMFWSDHGNGFPRAKRWLYDSGTHVPLMVRVPEKYRASTNKVPGSVDDRLICLTDLGPTVLQLAGVPVPAHMHGTPFLGKNSERQREYVYAARDRIDERFDLVRAVRDRRYRYVRTLMPWRPALQHKSYAERSVVRQEMRRLLSEGALKPELAVYFQTPRPFEELYDLETDPFELMNLAEDDQYAEHLVRLRTECDRWQIERRDLHLIPETILVDEEKESGSRWAIMNGANGEARCRLLLDIAKQAGRSLKADMDVVVPAMKSPDPAVRWWAVSALSSQQSTDQWTSLLKNAAGDDSAAVRIAAARGLGLAGEKDLAASVLLRELHNSSSFTRHAAILEVDESKSTLIKTERGLIQELADTDTEYINRVASHALMQK